MKKTLLTIRLFFGLLCVGAAYLIWFSNPDWERYLLPILFAGACVGTLTVLLDIFLKGFSLRGLTAVSFGLAMGSFVAWLLSSSPFFEKGDESMLFMVRLILFAMCTYIGTVVALRGRDEFNLVIPYVKFIAQEVNSQLVVVDTSALIDGRIVGICESRFLTAGLVIPRFVVEELHMVADSKDPQRRERGRQGLQVLNDLKRIAGLDVRIHESDVAKAADVDTKLVFVAKHLKARLFTLDYNLAQLAEFQGVEWLNLHTLQQALAQEMKVGELFEVELVKPGRESHQAVGYLPDGSMVVVNEGASHIGKQVQVEVTSVLPSAGGKLIFAKISGIPEAAHLQDVPYALAKG
ncbi:MAG: PIN/TRAM domain-containing protein [Opitutales bacterium]